MIFIWPFLGITIGPEFVAKRWMKSPDRTAQIPIPRRNILPSPPLPTPTSYAVTTVDRLSESLGESPWPALLNRRCTSLMVNCRDAGW